MSNKLGQDYATNTKLGNYTWTCKLGCCFQPSTGTESQYASKIDYKKPFKTVQKIFSHSGEECTVSWLALIIVSTSSWF